MSKATRPAPPDQIQRESALDPARSILVRAPAGSGKTDLLARRFLRLLAEVADPTHIVAITFTKAAAAEMRNRILSELQKASEGPSASTGDEFSLEVLAARAIERSLELRWNLLELPSQLRISTIDSFCREIALRRPLLSALGGGIEVSEQPEELYRKAARNTLLQLGHADVARQSPDLSDAIESLLLWRDNNWQELGNQLVLMLGKRDRWMQEFWLRDFDRASEADWQALRDQLERPFARAVAEQLAEVSRLLLRVPGACDEAMELARFACRNLENTLYNELAELAEFPAGPFPTAHELEDARQAYSCLAQLLLTNDGAFRQSVNKGHGFPADRKPEKQRLQELTQALSDIEGLQSALAAVRDLPSARYSEEDWPVVRACFTLLRHATGELQVAFAESGVVDFIEVAQIAQRILEDEDRLPSDAALALADDIHHLLVDEFQDTSRRQHKLLAALVSAWPDTSNRTLFVVGDPMQSIYFFRDADAELFPRVQSLGLELPDGEPLPLHFIQLASNFRTRPALVERLNETFESVFGVNDGSSVQFSASQPARTVTRATEPEFDLHLEFVPQIPRTGASNPDAARLKQEAVGRCEAALAAQTAQIVALIRSRMDRIERARTRGEKYRIAVLGRTRTTLEHIARALRDASIPFRAVDLEQLADRPEVLDALALARALVNREDRVAWLGVLRAPWCGLSLQDLHTLAGADAAADAAADSRPAQERPIPDLMLERGSQLSPEGRNAIDRVMQAYADAPALRGALPQMAPGAWLEQIWRRLGGDSCVDATARANLNLLWRCIDNLPGGEPDLVGSALQAALAKLTAQPDPAVESDCGVHLMTIHKSKGLEFEVVLVPDLQAQGGKTGSAMFSWLERGLEAPHESGAVTEFLIAPFQPKGGDRGKAKEWVDREHRARERQEMRRILYVAATRAREELHLFARPAYKIDQGEPVLCDPLESLLSTAWPALENDVRARFEAWKSNSQPAEVDAIAAGADNVIVMLAPAKPALLRRLPLDFAAPALPHIAGRAPMSVDVSDDSQLYRRHEGGLASRALGSAVHFLLQHIAQLRTTCNWDEVRASVPRLRDRLAADARAHGMDREAANTVAEQALNMALVASHDSIAQWILSPHVDAASEERWTGFIDGTLRTVQLDRVFRAGAEPLTEDAGVWWIVDYKTAHEDNLVPPEALPRLRQLFAPQLEAYAGILRKLHGSRASIRAGLYYPRMQQFDWWEL